MADHWLCVWQNRGKRHKVYLAQQKKEVRAQASTKEDLIMENQFQSQSVANKKPSEDQIKKIWVAPSLIVMSTLGAQVQGGIVNGPNESTHSAPGSGSGGVWTS